MKMKEVIAQTGLTDRAVRLYIDNGLITPENRRSYTGRNSFEFTQADVQQLEQIALLRKADFSIEQIKVLQLGGEPAREVLREYLAIKQESVSMGQIILEALKDFPTKETVTLESICERIKESLENTPLPEADRKETKAERLEKWIMRIAAIILLVYWGLLGVGVAITYREDFPFQHFYMHPINYIGTAYILIPVVLSAGVLLLYRKNLFVPKKSRKRRWMAGIGIATAFLMIMEPMGSTALHYIPPVYSQTSDPENYLVLGLYAKAYGDDIYKLFPANVPRCAVAEDSRWYPPDEFLETTKYYYYFQDVFDPSFQIYAEWILPEKEFAEELNRIRNYYPQGAKQQVQWGDWICLSFTEDTLDFCEAESLTHYYYLMFAYNEKTNAVRYIASYSMDCGREEDPYFLLLQW